ncbi:MAG: DUF371 domain-containing protein [Candidatus Lokiarchaeota archaeon]|nr:DUF371 domain-containing protein [Candidatus Lokiarchaeota archaeon]
MKVLDILYACGHENILSTHKSTIELTKDNFLTKKGNCIIGIKSTKSCKDLSLELKRAITSKKRIKVIIKVEDVEDWFYGLGNSRLTLTNEKHIVFRTSKYLCDRTALIECSKSSEDLDRRVINKLKTQGKRFSITFALEDSNG